MSTTTQPPKPKRRWYQFSLLTLLVVMTLFTVTLGVWIPYRRERAKDNRERLAAHEDKYRQERNSLSIHMRPFA